MKRLHQQRASSYGQVPFNYQDSSNISTTITPNVSIEITSENNKNKDDENDEEFILHPNFSIPSDIEIVKKNKLYFH